MVKLIHKNAAQYIKSRNYLNLVKCLFCSKIFATSIKDILKIKSCGCMRAKALKLSNTKHGFCGKGNIHPTEYTSWREMKTRCYNKNNKSYKNYGARGIKVCDGWLNSFENFYIDMGPKPKGYSLDRINNDGDYEPSNCRWATALQQANNRRPKVKGK